MCKQYQTDIKRIGKLTLIWWYLLALMMVFSIAILLCGCKTIKSTETTTESHKVSQMVERMDSLIHSTATWQQDLYQKQSSLVDSFKEREKNDSSHSVVINEKGDTVRERIEIIRYIEREHNTESKESETWIQKFKEVDSLLKVSLDKQAVTDSLLREHDKYKEVVKEPSLWDKAKYGLIGIVFIVLLYLIFRFYGFIRKLIARDGYF